MAENSTSSTATPRKAATRKSSTRKAPAKGSTAKKTPARRAKSGGAAKDDHHVRNRTLAALGVVGAAAAGVGWALSIGLFDKLLGASDAEHAAPDLASGEDVHAGRAPDAFRPDPTAPVSASEREGLRPATGASPSLVADRGEMNSQTAPAFGEA